MLGAMGPVTTMVVLVVAISALGTIIHTLIEQWGKVAIEREQTKRKRLDVELKSIEATTRTIEAYPLRVVEPEAAPVEPYTMTVDGNVIRASAPTG